MSTGQLLLGFSVIIFLFLLSTVTSYSTTPIEIRSHEELSSNPQGSSPFSVALQILQKQIGYNFRKTNFLIRAMTHPSYSRDNNQALSIMGSTIIETSISFRSVDLNIDISAKDLNDVIAKITKVDTCAVDGLHLGLEKVVRVWGNTNASTPSVVCGAFRATFGAIALDSSKVDVAVNVFWNVTKFGGDRASSM